MTFFTKFWRAKLVTVAVTLAATLGVWGLLAWPDWTSADDAWSKTAVDPQVTALQALAALPPEQLAALSAPPPPAVVAAAPPPVQPQTVYRQVVVVTRHQAPASGADTASNDGLPPADQHAVAQAQDPAANPQPAQQPKQPSQPAPAPQPQPKPVQPAPAPKPAPPPPAPAPAPAPAPPPAPAPAPPPDGSTNGS